MKKKKLLAATMMAAGLLASSAAYSTDVGTWGQLESGLTNGGDFTATGDIEGANSVVNGKNSTLNLAGKTLSGATSVTAGLSFSGNKNLTLTGGGTISNFYRPDTNPTKVDGTEYGIIDSRNSSVLTMTGGEWEFSNNKSGVGSINTLNSSISANVDKIVFDGNISNAQGAGLRHQISNNAYIENSASIVANEIVFNNNKIETIGNFGDAVVGGGGAVMNSGGTMKLLGGTNTFTNNKMNATIAEGRRYKVGGGAVINQSHQMGSGDEIDSTMVIGKADGSSINTFSGNTSSTSGGAVMNRAVDEDGNATLTINGNTTFSGNTATQNGGAIYNVGMGKEIKVGGDWVLKERAFLTQTGSAEFDGNTAGSRGGAIYNAGVMTLNDATFTSNRTTNDTISLEYGTQGGAIYNAGADDLYQEGSNYYFTENGKLTINGATFGSAIDNKKGNSAIQGGAIANSADESGFGYIGTIVLNNTNFYYNKARADQDSSDGYSYSAGGAIWNDDGNITVTGDTEFIGNTAEGYAAMGGAIRNGYGDMTFNDEVSFDSNISERTIAGNGAQGGAINNEGTMTFKDAVTFTGNQAKNTVGQTSGLTYLSKGGAIYNESYGTPAAITFEKGATFVNNQADLGGAIFNNEGTINLTDATFTDNTANADGGAIFNYSGSTVNINAVNSDVVFSGNMANDQVNDIYNTGTVNFVAAADKNITLEGIQGPGGTITKAGAGTLNVSEYIANQTVNVNAGELHLTTESINGANLAGSTVNIASGATINTIDDAINDYMTGGDGKGIITLADGAKIKGDVNYIGATADTYLAEDGATVKYSVANLIGDIGKDNKTIQVTSSGATVDISEAVFNTQNGLTFTSSGSADGKMVVKGVAGGINGAVKTTDEQGADIHTVNYEMTANETFNPADDSQRTIESADFTIKGGNKTITANDANTKGFVVAKTNEGTSTLTASNVTFDSFKADGGAIENNGTLNLDNVIFSNNNVAVKNNSGATVNSSDTEFGAKIINEGNFNIEYTDEYSPKTAAKTINTDLTGTNGKTTVFVENGAAVNWNPVNQAVQNEFTFDGSGHLALGGEGFKGNVINKMTGDTLEITSLIDGNVNSTSDPAGQNHISITGNGAVTGLITNSGKLDILKTTPISSTDTTYIIEGGIADVATPNGTTNIGDTTHNVVASLAADNTIVQKIINIASGSKLSAAAGKITASTFENNGIYAVQGGADADHYVTNALAVSGSGKTQVTGFVTQNAAIASTSTDADALSIDSGAGLQITGDNLQAKTTNAGTLSVTAGTISKAIAGAGTLKTADGVAIDGSTSVTQGALDVTGTLTNGGTLTVNGNIAGTSTPTITGTTGTVNLNGGTSADAMATNAAAINLNRVNVGGFVDSTNGSIIANYIEIGAGKRLKTNAGNISLKEGSAATAIINEGDLELTGGTIKSTIDKNTSTTSKIIVSGDVNFANNTVSTNNAILINGDGAKLTAVGKNIDNNVTNNVTQGFVLTGGEFKKGISGTGSTVIQTANATDTVTFSGTDTIAQDVDIIKGIYITDGSKLTKDVAISENGTLQLTGGNFAGNIFGYQEGSADPTYGKLIIKDSSTINSGVNSTTTVKELDVEEGKTLTASGDVTVNETLGNAGTITIATGKSLNIVKESEGAVTNAGTISGAGTLVIGDGDEQATSLTNSGTISSSINIKSDGTLTTATSGLTTSSDIANDGKLIFNNSADGTIAQNITKSTAGTGTGIVEIAAADGIKIGLNGKTITNNSVKLTSGIFDVGTASGNVDVSGMNLIANGGTLSVQDGKTGAINLGNVNTQTGTNAKDLNVKIDTNFATDTSTWTDHGIEGHADIISATVTGDKGIHISDIRMTADPIATEMKAQIATGSAINQIDVTNTTISNMSDGAGSLMLSYDNTNGYLTGTHTDLNNAIKSTITSKMYSMSANESIDNSSDALSLGGTSLSITGNGFDITGSTAANDGIKIASSGQTLSITGTPKAPDTTNTVISGFKTAIDNTAGGTVNLTDVTMTGNTTDVANAGTLNLANTGTNTNSINTISGTGTTNINGGTTTVNTSLAQGTVNVGVETPSSNASLISKGAMDVTTLNVKTEGSSFTNEGGNTTTPAQIGTLNNKGSVENKGVLNIATAVDNDGTLTNNGGTLKGAAIDNSKDVINKDNGTIENAINNTVAGAKIDNQSGEIKGNIANTVAGTTIENKGGGTISGSISNIADATVNNYSGATITGDITNNGVFNNSGTVNNANISNSGTGTLANSGSITSTNAIDNDGILANAGNITAGIDNDGTINNYENGKITGAIDNAAGKNVNNYANATIEGNVTNAGNLVNAGTVTGTKHTNTGDVQNSGSITATSTDADAFDNDGTLTNAGTITANIDNDGTVNNYGAITGAIDNAAGKNVNNYADATITGNVTNAGNLANAGTTKGDITNTGNVTNDGTIQNGTLTNQNNGTVDNTAIGTIASNIDNEVGGTVNNEGAISGTINNKSTVDGSGAVTGTGTVNTIASGITGTVNNDGILNLNDGDGTKGTLGTSIASGTNNTGTTNVKGDVTSDKNITQDTVNVGNDGTGSAPGSLTNTGNIVADDVNVTAGGTLNQNGGSIGTTANPATITNNGTTNINGGSVVADTITNKAGSTTINQTGDNDSVIADAINNEAGNTNIASTVNADKINAKGGAVNVDATADSVANTSDLLANKAGDGAAAVTIAEGAKVAVKTDNASLKVDNNVATSDPTDPTVNNGTLELTGKEPGSRQDPAHPEAKSDSEDVGTRFSVDPNNTVNADIDLQKGELATDGSNINGTISAAADATINAKDGKTSDVGNVNMANGAYVKTDVNAMTSKSDTFNDLAAGNNKYLTDLGIQDLDKFAYDHKSINLTSGTGLNNLQMTDALKANLEKNYSSVLTPVRKMDARVSVDDAGNLMLNFTGTGNDYKDFNPAIMASPVAAQLGGFLVQLNSYDQAFNNMDQYMLMTRKQRQALKLRNKIAATEGNNIAYDPTMTQNDYAGGWFRPYASFEKVGLAGGPKVENNMYGAFVGGESSMKDLGNGWDGMWGAYIGYNGAHQNYDSVSMYENGGTLGLVGMAYKDNFFVGATINGGMMAGQADTMYGSEDFNMVLAGIAAKTGYNWELADGKFIIQPSLQTSYSFVNTFDYHNAANVYVDSDPLHAITLEPGIKFIGNLKNGWQPYAGISAIFNIMDRTHFHANDVNLPNLSVSPYAKYGIGVRKTWGERFSGFFQMFVMSGGRNGFGMQGGFKWAIGANGTGHISKDAKNPELKKTTINLQNKKASVK